MARYNLAAAREVAAQPSRRSPPMRDIPSQGQLLRVLRRRWWILALCVIVGGGSAFALARHARKQYSSTGSVLFQASQLDEKLFGTTYSPVYVDPDRQAQTNLNLVTLPVVAQGASAALGGTPSAPAIAHAITALADGNSTIVNVTAQEPSPALAARVVNAYLNAFVAYRRAAEQSQAYGAADLVQTQLSSLERSSPRSSQVASLQQRITSLRVLASLQTGDVQVAQAGQPPTAPSAPSITKDSAFGLIFGLLVGILAIALAERLDRTLVDAEDAEAAFGLPVLGLVPTSRGFDQGRGSRASRALTTGESEVFRLLRARLRYFNVDKDVTTILVTSAAPADGKSTVAWHLARTAAELAPDASVLLLEADLRRPSLARAAGLPAAPGLSELLSHEATLEESVQRVPVAPGGSSPGRASVNLITSGTLPPNPTELLESNRMRDLLGRLAGVFDLVIVDAPPTLFVSDAIALIRQVDGVLVVGRLRHTRRDAARHLRDQLAQLSAPTLGLVLNGVKFSDTGYYTYRDDTEYAVQAAPATGTASWIG